MDLQQAPQLSADCRGPSKKNKSGVGKFFFGIGAVSSLDSFPGPQAACSHDHLFLGCLPGPLSLGTVGRCASLLLGCPPGPLVSWVPCGASRLDALPGWLLGRPPGPLVSSCPARPAAWVPSGPRSACSAAACHHWALTEITIKTKKKSGLQKVFFFLRV